MNTDDAKETVNRLADNVSDAAQRAGNLAQDAGQRVSGLAHDATQRVSEFAHDAGQRVSGLAHDAAEVVKQKADRSISVSQDYVRGNPLPTILGALAVGMVVGYLVSRREEEEKVQKLAREPLHAARDAVYSILGPISDRLHHQYDSAKDSADDLYHRINSRKNRKAAEGLLDDARKLGSSLKFW